MKLESSTNRYDQFGLRNTNDSIRRQNQAITESQASFTLMNIGKRTETASHVNRVIGANFCGRHLKVALRQSIILSIFPYHLQLRNLMIFYYLDQRVARLYLSLMVKRKTARSIQRYIPYFYVIQQKSNVRLIKAERS